jgi:hypothetical protein
MFNFVFNVFNIFRPPKICLKNCSIINSSVISQRQSLKTALSNKILFIKL